MGRDADSRPDSHRAVGRTLGPAHGNQRYALQDHHIIFEHNDPALDLFDHVVAQLPNAKIILLGHLHMPLTEQWHDVLLVSPGFDAPSHEHPTFASINLDHEVEATIVPL